MGERERENERPRRGRGEEEAKGTETSLLCGFQQKLVVVNNAHYSIHGEGGEERRERVSSGGKGRGEERRKDCIYLGGLSEAQLAFPVL